LEAGGTVTIDISGAFCDSMLWSVPGHPTFQMGSGDLTVSGSMILQQNMNLLATGSNLIFNSRRQNETVRTFNHDMLRTVTFNGIGGWIIYDSLKVIKNGMPLNINYLSGNLNLNGNYMICNRFLSTGTPNTRALNISNSTIDVNNWYFTTGSTPVVGAGSFITVHGADFSGKVGDRYGTVIAGTGMIQWGHYEKIFMSHDESRINSTTSTTSADTLILNYTDSSPEVTTYYITGGTSVGITHQIRNTRNTTDCSEKINLVSTNTTMATISMGHAAVADLNNVDFKYISFAGVNRPYLVDNANDLGNSDGWDVLPVSRRLYWVRGEGNWNDMMHWSKSGGDLSNTCYIPNRYTTVIFNDDSELLSGNKVFLNINGACDSMLWMVSAPHAPVFAMTDRDLSIYGSLQLQPNMTLTTNPGTNYINFVSERPGEFIRTENHNLLRTLVFSSPTGGWQLQDSLKVAAAGDITFDIRFEDGALDLNGNYMRCATLFSDGSNARSLNIAGSTIDLLNWFYINSTTPLRSPQTNGSTIRVMSGFTGKPGDEYNVVYAGSGDTYGGTFKKLIVEKNQAILNSFIPANDIIVDTLIFGMGNTYTVYRGRTVHVRKYIGNTNITGDCIEMITLQSEMPANPGIFALSAGATMALNNISFRNIYCTGPGAPYLVNNSVNMGGSGGIQFTTLSYAGRLYWVGGSGDWNNPDHWSRISGENANYCRFIPNATTTVVFDENSGLNAGGIVYLNIAGNCDSMLWTGTGTPRFAMNNYPLNMHGSLLLQKGMRITNQGSQAIIINSARAGGEFIKTNNVVIPRSISLNNTTGATWQIYDSLNLSFNSFDLTLMNGNLAMNGNYLSCNNFTLEGNTPLRRVNLANCTIDVNNWNYSGGGGASLNATETANSYIRVRNNFTGKAGDTYNVVEAGSGALRDGNYSKVLLNKNGGMLGAATTAATALRIDTLIMTMGNTYYVERGRTVNINRYFAGTRLTTDCPLKTTLRSDAATVANIIMGNATNAASVDLNNVDFYFINMSGPAQPYTVPNFVNLGGSSGVQLPPAYVGRFYWIGGTGNWNELSHWSSTSGGAPNICRYPSATNTVVFDNNSGLTYGQTVTLNTAATCDSMLWIGGTSPVFAMANQPLTISGSLELRSGMRITGSTGTITFTSSRSAETIRTHNIVIPRAVTFDGTGGWILLDNLLLTDGSTRYNLTFNSGNLTMSNREAVCANFSATAANARTLNISGATLDVTNWTYTGNTAAPVTTNSLIKVAAAFTGKPGDNYSVVEAGTGILQGGTFRKIIMNKTSGTLNSTITANHVTTDTLSLEAGPVYNITAGTTLTINRYLTNGNSIAGCSDRMSLRSTVASAAFIQMGTPSVVNLANIDFYFIRINGPGTPYPVSGSVDLGGSMGWMSISIPRLYWIGGSGNWNDREHWSFTSGGAPACVTPLSGTTVVFDENSGLQEFSTVNLNVTATCDSML